MFRDLRRSWELVWRFFLRDFKARHRQAALGVSWALILPLVAVSGFMFMRQAGILNVGATSVPYPLFALIGITIWQIFASGLIGATASLVTGGDVLFKIKFPKEVLVFASLGGVAFDTLVRLALVAVGFAVFQVSPAPTAWLLPIALVPLLVLTLGLGLVCAVLNSLLRDVGKAIGLINLALLAITPVLYPNPGEGLLGDVMRYNPLVPLLDLPRRLLIGGAVGDVSNYVVSSMLAALVLIGGWRLFRVAEPRIAERI